MWVLLGILNFGFKMLIKFLNLMFFIVENGCILYVSNLVIVIVMF